MAETVSEKMEKAIKAARGQITSRLTPSDSPYVSQAVANLMRTKSLAARLSSNELDDEIGILLDRVRPNLPPLDLQKATTAVLDLMNAKAHSEGVNETQKGRGPKTN